MHYPAPAQALASDSQGQGVHDTIPFWKSGPPIGLCKFGRNTSDVGLCIKPNSSKLKFGTLWRALLSIGLNLRVCMPYQLR